MAGHSHWANIKRKKEAQDKKKSLAFSKAAKLILTAIKEGGPNPDTNNSLKIAIAYAKQVKMPNANIERLIKKHLNKKNVAYKEAIYEGLFKNVPILIRALTDNPNRTVNDLKQVFNEFGARLVEKGAVSWQFEQVGLIVVLVNGQDYESQSSDSQNSGNAENFEQMQMQILDLIDVIDFNEFQSSGKLMLKVYVAREKLKEFTDLLQKNNITVLESKLHYTFTGDLQIDITNEIKQKFNEFKQKVLDLDDVTDIWTALDN